MFPEGGLEGQRMRLDLWRRRQDREVGQNPPEQRVLVASAIAALTSLAILGSVVVYQSLPPAAPFVNGTVKQVDPRARTITFEHDAIPNLCMESMVMMFEAANSQMLASLKVGDRVRFTAEEIENHPVITRLEKQSD